jgi:FkbM family methyltransferase
VVEPGRSFRVSLEANRQCELDFRAIWNVTGDEIVFKEDTIEGYLSVAVEDELIDTKNSFSEYKVETVTLFDLLKQYRAPKEIEYISVDIEGSELRVLEAFFKENDFFNVKCWTVEHNFRNSKSDLEKLFSLHGYKAVHKELSYRDYWFKKE